MMDNFDEVCECGHTRESHLSKDNWRDGKCVWRGCKCDKFVLVATGGGGKDEEI